MSPAASPSPGQYDQFTAEADHFAACIRNNKTPDTPGEEGLADMLAIESHLQGRRHTHRLTESSLRKVQQLKLSLVSFHLLFTLRRAPAQSQHRQVRCRYSACNEH